MIGSASNGSSFVAVQRWLHDFDAFEATSSEQQAAAIGRQRETIERAPRNSMLHRHAKPPAALMDACSLLGATAFPRGLHKVPF
ncbi:hypothetical protein ACFL2H_02525 [Planctomycetota bacterium]